MGNSSSSNKRPMATHELERYTRPTGLYTKCPWDLKTARRLILERKIAPRVPGKDFKESFYINECPICFMYYPGSLNHTLCCKKPICSECFFQVTLPKQSKSCPYCNGEALTITYIPPPDAEIIAATKPQRSASVEMPRHSNKNHTNTHSPTAHIYAMQKKNYASVQDRQKLRDDLRSQLNISSEPIRHSMPSRLVGESAVTDPLQTTMTSNRAVITASISTTAAQAVTNMSQLEELMMMEAIRRSIYDMNMAKEASGAGQHADNYTTGDDDVTSNSQEHELDYVYEDEDDEYSYDGSSLGDSDLQEENQYVH